MLLSCGWLPLLAFTRLAVFDITDMCIHRNKVCPSTCTSLPTCTRSVVHFLVLALVYVMYKGWVDFSLHCSDVPNGPAGEGPLCQQLWDAWSWGYCNPRLV